MVERREDLRFPFESGEAVGVKREVVGEDLERDVPAESGIPGFPDLSHLPGPDGRKHLIRAEA